MAKLKMMTLGAADVLAAGIVGSASATYKMSDLGITQLNKEKLSAGKGAVLLAVNAKDQVAFEMQGRVVKVHR